MPRKISLTVDERVILHLQEFVPFEEDFEAPEGATQAGIARGVGIDRKHVPRAVNKLVEEGLLHDRLAHVKGAKQRKKVYFLTFEGKNLARRIWDSLSKKEVIIREDSGKEMVATFSELCFTHQVGRTPIELLMQLDDGMFFYPHRKTIYQKKKEDKKHERELTDARAVYKKALSKAWEDNILTKDEEALLDELRASLGISREEHKVLQEEVIDEIRESDKPMNRGFIFKSILDVAMSDGRVTEDEQNMLDELARILRISEKDITNAKMEAKLLEGERSIPKEKEREIFHNIYQLVLKESLRDGRISRDEENIIKLLKELFSINEKEHLKIVKEMKLREKGS